eukprot:763163-Hanusia_phi.AAC.1
MQQPREQRPRMSRTKRMNVVFAERGEGWREMWGTTQPGEGGEVEERRRRGGEGGEVRRSRRRRCRNVKGAGRLRRRRGTSGVVEGGVGGRDKEGEKEGWSNERRKGSDSNLPKRCGEKTRQEKTRQDKTRQDKTRQDKTRQDKTRQDKTRQDKTRQDKTRQDTRYNKGRNATLHFTTQHNASQHNTT